MSVSPVGFTTTPYDKVVILKKNELTKVMMTEKDFQRMSPVEFAFKTTINPVLKGALIGTGLGATTGATVGILGGPPGVLVGTAKGAFAGLLVGTLGGVIYMAISRSEYKIWRTKHSEDDVIQAFKELHESNNALQSFVCPISQAPFYNPVRDKFGNIYEREEIITWIQTNADAQGFAMDPKRNGRVSINDLEPYPQVMVKMEATYSKILNEDASKNNIHPEVKEGLKRAAQHFQDKVKAFTERKSVEFLKQFRSGGMSSVEYASAIAKLLKEISPES